MTSCVSSSVSCKKVFEYSSCCGYNLTSYGPTYLPPGVPVISGKVQGLPTHLGMPKTELAPPDQSPYQHLSLDGPFLKYPEWQTRSTSFPCSMLASGLSVCPFSLVKCPPMASLGNGQLMGWQLGIAGLHSPRLQRTFLLGRFKLKPLGQ